MMTLPVQMSDYRKPLRTVVQQLVDVPAGHEALLEEVSLSGIALDSRKVRPGDLFVALHGLTHDARHFIPDALAAGAVAVIADRGAAHELSHRHASGVPVLLCADAALQLGVLASRYFDHPSQQLDVVAVTGTNGKTTTAQLVAGALTQLGKRCGVMGTVGNGFYGELTTATHTTPDALSLHAWLAHFVAEGAQAVAMEASSHGLVQGRMNAVRVHTAVFTNITRDHLDYHGDMQAYAEAKRRLFLQADLRHAVINLDDDHAGELLGHIPQTVQVLGYGLLPHRREGVYAQAIRSSMRGLEIELCGHVGEQSLQGQTLRSPLLGRFNASNLLAVLASLLSLNVALADALAALAAVPAVAGRMQALHADDGGPTVVVDYAHTPDALEKVLQAVRPHVAGAGRVICVFGCGGDRDKGKRVLMAAVAEKTADQVWVTSDNPRSETAEKIIDDIFAGFSRPEHVLRVPDRAEAIRCAIAGASADDVVVIAGKGHENYQEVAGVRHAFSDVVQVQQALGLPGGMQ